MTTHFTVRSLLLRSSMIGALASASAANLAAQTGTAAPPASGAAQATVATTGATGAPPAMPLPAPRQSWISDRRNFAVGDLITILIDDYTITTAVKENIANDTRTRGLSASVRLPSGMSKGAGLDTRNDATQNTRGSAKRENRFQNEMSVRVVAIAPNGLLQLKGQKNINVDKNVQDIVLTGFVRQEDITAQNEVESARVADITIGYSSPGSLAKPRQGLISKVLGAIWP